MAKKLNILIVDDCKVMQAVIRRTLKLAKINTHTVDTADNGKSGLQMLKKNGYDLLVLDVNMPVMDGMELIHQVKKDPSIAEMPVLIVSAESNEGRKKTLSGLGAGFVHKPFTPEVLREEILKVAGGLVKPI